MFLVQDWMVTHEQNELYTTVSRLSWSVHIRNTLHFDLNFFNYDVSICISLIHLKVHAYVVPSLFLYGRCSFHSKFTICTLSPYFSVNFIIIRYHTHSRADVSIIHMHEQADYFLFLFNNIFEHTYNIWQKHI